jgi:hypothetical protein
MVFLPPDGMTKQDAMTSGEAMRGGDSVVPPVSVDLMPSGALTAVGVQAAAALNVGGRTLNNGGDHRVRLQLR